MNLEEKANSYLDKVGLVNDEHNRKILLDLLELFVVCCKKDFTAGYNECKADLTEFIRANPKSTAEQILNHLEEQK